MLHDATESDRAPMRRILFVDDEPRVLDGLRRILRGERKQWEMTFVAGVDAALEVLGGTEHDVVVSDIDMPGRDGFDLLQTIRADSRLTDIPVVILTGNGEQGMKRRALDLGATDLLNKPVERDDLIARLRSALRLKEYTDEIKAYSGQLEQRVRQRTAALEFARAELIWRLGKAGEFRDSDTGYHVVRVGYYSKLLAEALGLDAGEVQEIFLAAPLHDIGKIGIPDRILKKPGKLLGEEWEIMMTHTRIGGEILRARAIATKHARVLNALADIDQTEDNPFTRIGASIAESHHERWDGAGYPRALSGDAIPLAARIATVADVFDALSSKRPYKPAMEEEQVLNLLRSGAGTQFDPAVMEAFERSLDGFREVRFEFRDEDMGEPQADVDQSVMRLLSDR